MCVCLPAVMMFVSASAQPYRADLHYRGQALGYELLAPIAVTPSYACVWGRAAAAGTAGGFIAFPFYLL